MTRKLQDAVRQQKKQTKQANHQIYGLLGIPINGAKTTEVPNRNSYVYVRLRNNQSEVIQAFNNKVSPAYNLPVIVERLGGRYTVVSVDTQRYENNWTSYAPFLPRHGNTHSFDPESGGGGDTVFVHTRQFMPLLAFPSGSSGGPNVVIYPYMLKNDNGTWKYVGSTGTQDITTYNPTSATGAIMVLVYLDSVSGNPYLMVGSGTVFSNSITGTSQIAPYIPTVTNASTQIPISAIRLVTGTSQLSWDNIYDVRQFLHGVPTGTGGGGGSVTGTSDSTYLRLDTTNDPLTGQLQIIPITPDDGGAYIQTMNDAYTLDVEQLATGTATVTSPALFVYRGSQGASTPTFNNPMIEAVQINSGTTTGEFLTFNSNGVRRVSIHPSAVGTGTLAFFDSNNTLSNDGNLLLLKNNGSPKTKIAAQGNIEFGLGIVKQPGAGSIGYGLVDSGLLNIIGGGTSVPNRTVKLYDNLTVNSLMTANNYTVTSLTNTLLATDSSGNFISGEPTNDGRVYGRSTSNWVSIPSGTPTAETNTEDIFTCTSPGGISMFVGSIATLPGGATLTYNVTLGQEAVMVSNSTSQLAKLRIYNTTRGNYALISNCNTSTNTITLTTNVPASWATTDIITVASQAVSGGGVSWMDVEFTSGLVGKSSVLIGTYFQSASSGDLCLIHPFETFSSSKYQFVQSAVTNIYTTAIFPVKLNSNVFSIGWTGSPTTISLKESGYLS